MKKYKLVISSLVAFIAAVTLAGCMQGPPGPALILKAKNQTQAIVDSLQNKENLIVEQFELTSEFFDDKSGKYVMNYHIRVGMDSVHIADDEATAFLEKQNGDWKYTFNFDKTYIRDISNE